MKLVLTVFYFFLTTLVWCQNSFISEIHYENSGTDINERVEVTIPAECNCTSIEIVGYDGTTGMQYNSWTQTTTISNSEQYITIPVPGIENGTPDGIALVCNGGLMEFISYGGSFMATNGIAVNQNSSDIVSLESDTTLSTQSLKLNDGNVWIGPSPNSFSSLNSGLASTTPIFSLIDEEYCEGDSVPNLPNTSDNGILGTWSPSNNIDTSSIGVTDYVFNASSQCTSESFTLTITVTGLADSGTLTATKDIICIDDRTQSISTNGDPGGNWVSTNTSILTINSSGMITPVSPGVVTVRYVFPSRPPCNTLIRSSIDIEIIPAETVSFTTLPLVHCVGDSFSLPTVSNEGFTGTWVDELGNTITAIDTTSPFNPLLYTFMVDVGQGCLANTPFSFSVEDCACAMPSEVTIDTVTEICENETLSLNAVVGGSSAPVTSVTWATTGTGTFDDNNSFSPIYTPAIEDLDSTLTFFVTTNDSDGTDICSEFTASTQVFINQLITPRFFGVAARCEGNTEFNPFTNRSQSREGITGTWSPEYDPNQSGVYTFTPDDGQCAVDDVTINVRILQKEQPTFDELEVQCEGGDNPLPSISLEGFIGTWQPTFDPNNSTVYTFIPEEGECALSGSTLSVTIQKKIEPTFDPLPSQCEGGSNPLPTISLEGFVGTWQPTFDPNTSQVYTFIPDEDECATADSTIDISIDLKDTPSFDTIAPQCIDSPNPLQNISNEGFIGNWEPIYNPTISQVYRFVPDDGQCVRDDTTLNITITDEQQPTFNELPAQCEGGINPLPTTSLEGFSGTWTPTFNPNFSQVYTFTPNADECALTGSTLSVTIDQRIQPTFDALQSQCEGGPNPLPTNSLEGFSGSWDPAFDPNISQVYTFIPDDIECALTGSTLNVSIENKEIPTFNAVAAQCEGGSNPLPASSLEGFAGSWDPAFDPDISQVYTFIPEDGLCVRDDATLNVTINQKDIPTFNAIPTQCEGEENPLPTSSLEGFAGTWEPTFDPENSQAYTFIPENGQCVRDDATLNVTIQLMELPTFDTLPAQCEDSPNPLPNTSLEGFTGSWSPTYDPATTQEYLFTPDPNQCALTGATLTVLVMNETPSFTLNNLYCYADRPDILSTTSDNGFEGIWDTDTIDSFTIGTTTYTFTPFDDFCTEPFLLEVIVEPCDCVFETENEITVCQGDELMVNGNLFDTSRIGIFSNQTLTPVVDSCDELFNTSITVIGPMFPTAFSPNNRDGVNDEFKIIGTNFCVLSDFSLVIYNQWGDQVFETTNPDQGWTGQINQNGAIQFGTYVWSATYTINDNAVSQQGSVSIVN